MKLARQWRGNVRLINLFGKINMKPSLTFIVTCLFVFINLFLYFYIQTRTLNTIIKTNSFQIRTSIDEIKVLKEKLNSDPNEVVTKADLAVLEELTDHQNMNNRLLLDNKIELSKGISNIPNFVLFIIILFMSFQIMALDKKIQKRIGEDKSE